MHILDQIVVEKKKEIEKKKGEVSISKIKESPFFYRKCYSLKQSLKYPESTGIIAEFKRASPSKGIMNPHAIPSEVTKMYSENGAAGISVLTDEPFFKGHSQDLIDARLETIIPILRKDFILDEHQIYEAKSIGADVVLLIASILDKKKTKNLACCAHDLGLEVLFEIHSEEELDLLCEEIDLVGVNNRNLKTFELSIQNSINLVDKIPSNVLKISESGISEVSKIKELRKTGFDGFLMGEHFMKTKNPGQSLKSFVHTLSTFK